MTSLRTLWSRGLSAALFVIFTLNTAIPVQAAPLPEFNAAAPNLAPEDLFELDLELDGVDDYATAADNATLDLGTGATDDFTFETFFYVPDLTNTTTDTLIWKNGAYGLYILYYTAQPDRFIYRLNTGPTTYVYLMYNVDLTVGWHHVAAVFDNEYTASWDYFGLYFDGNLVASSTGVEWTPGIPNSSSALAVGGYMGLNPYHGWLEETRLSNTVRYSGSTYIVPTAPFTPDGSTRGLWHYNEAWGSTSFADSSGNGNTLTGVNGAHVGSPTGSQPAPEAFNKSTPANGAGDQSLAPTLLWNTSAGAASYEYCYDTSDNNTCNGSWTSTGSATSAGLSGLSGNTTYYWQVRAVNPGGTTEADSGAWWSFITVPNPPGAFGKSAPGHGAVDQALAPTLSWNTSSGAVSYEYCYDTSNNDTCNGTWTSTGSATSAGLSGLSTGTTYYWQVRALNPGGATEADGGAWWSFTTLLTPPAAFQKSAPGNGAADQSLAPTLSWNASSGAASYEYCYDTSNNDTCNGSWTSTGSATSAGLSGLSASTTYYWQVRAVNPGGTTEADSGTWWSFTTVPEAPGPFGKSAPANGAADQLLAPTLSWNASSGAVSYEYCYDTSNNDTCNGTWTSTGSATSAGLSGLSTGTTYYWQVRALNPGGATEADGGAWWSFTTVPEAPGPYGKSAPANGTVDQALAPTLSWNTSSGAASYEYCYDTTDNNTCNGSWTSTGSTTSAGLSGLSTGTTYYWQARAVNPGGTTEADGGTWWSFTTVPEAPGPFGKSAPANGAVDQAFAPTLSWDASSGAVSYEYCYDTTDNETCNDAWTSTGSATSAGLSGLSSGTTYFWQVRAVNPGGATEADGGTWWLFTTLPEAPGPFGKSAPANGAVDQALAPTLSWGASSGAASYEYCYDTSNNDTCNDVWNSTGSATSADLSGLSASTTYYWQARALNPGGTIEADGGSWWSITTAPEAPGPFGKSAPANGAVDQALAPTLSWNASSSAVSYEYCYDTTDNETCNDVWNSTGSITSVDLSGLSASTTYYWQARAVNPGGATEADGGTWWLFTTLPEAPGSFGKSAPANGAVDQTLAPTLSWNASSGAASYEYCYDTSNNDTCNGSWTSTGSATSAGLSGLSTGTTYFWQVRALNAGGTTEADGGTWWSFTTTFSTAPAAPTMTAPPAYTNDATPSIEGTAEAGSLVYVLYWSGTWWTPVCDEVPVDGSGNWACVSAATLPEGPIQLSAYAVHGGASGPASTRDFTLDLTAPHVFSITRADDNPTSADVVHFTVTFDEPVTGVAYMDFTLDVTGTLSGGTIDPVTGSNESYTVPVNIGSGSGTLTMNVPVDAEIQDLAGNALTDLPFTQGQVYDIYKGTGIDVNINTFMGNYGLTATDTMTVSYPAMLNGPVNVLSMDASPIFTSQRVTSGASYNELMGVPPSQFTTEYWFPFYDHGYSSVPNNKMRTWILVGNPDEALTANVDVYIGGVLRGEYAIPPGDNITPRWTGLVDGPVRVVSDIPVFASERVFTVPNNSFNEVMGYPADQFTTEYWFPWYDSVSMNASILVGNTSSSLTADVDIFIGPNFMGNYDILPNETLIQSYPSTINGPVRVVATNGVDIVASEAALSGPVGNFTAYNEVMGYPFDQFATEYHFPWYDHGYPSVGGSNMRTWILVGNPDNTLTADVDIFIDGALQGSYSVPPNSRITPRWVGLQAGPVQVVSDIPVFTSERVFTSPSNVFNEMMGYPSTGLTFEYWFAWYDSVNMTNDILIARP